MTPGTPQLELFGLDAFRERQPKAPSARVAAVVLWFQLDLLSPAWLNRLEDEDDDPLIDPPIVHRIVLALEAEPPQTTGIPSVFGLAAVVLSKGRPPDADGERQAPVKPHPPRYGVTTREVGVVRHKARRECETEAWAEKERKRRAKQRVPRPTNRARTRGKKLLDLIGHE